jgi:hypothetical protein
MCCVGYILWHYNQIIYTNNNKSIYSNNNINENQSYYFFEHIVVVVAIWHIIYRALIETTPTNSSQLHKVFCIVKIYEVISRRLARQKTENLEEQINQTK